MRPLCNVRAFALLFGLFLGLLFTLADAVPGVRASVALAAEDRQRFGIAMPSFRESRWQLDLQAFQTEAALRQVDILVRFAGNDQKQQNLQVMELVNVGIDALIIAPNDVLSAAEGVEYARAHGVPVISYDRLAEKCSPDAYVTFDRLGVGELMGRYLAAHVPHGGIILLRGPQSDSNSRDYFDGAIRYLGPLIKAGALNVVLEAEVPEWRADMAEKLVDQALAGTLSVRAVLAPNDDTAGGVVKALERHGLSGAVCVTGQDATAEGLRRVLAGTQGMTVYKDVNQLARRAVAVARELASGTTPFPDGETDNGKERVPTYVQPVAAVEKDSLDWFLRQPEFD